MDRCFSAWWRDWTAVYWFQCFFVFCFVFSCLPQIPNWVNRKETFLRAESHLIASRKKYNWQQFSIRLLPFNRICKKLLEQKWADIGFDTLGPPVLPLTGTYPACSPGLSDGYYSDDTCWLRSFTTSTHIRNSPLLFAYLARGVREGRLTSWYAGKIRIPAGMPWRTFDSNLVRTQPEMYDR